MNKHHGMLFSIEITENDMVGCTYEGNIFFVNHTGKVLVALSTGVEDYRIDTFRMDEIAYE